MSAPRTPPRGPEFDALAEYAPFREVALEEASTPDYRAYAARVVARPVAAHPAYPRG